MNDKVNDFDQFVSEAICALNRVITCKEVCNDDKAVLKVNRFKRWLNDYYDQIGKKEIAQGTETEVEH